ncbi:MAG: hypothetical protein ACLQBY_09330 [Solirubrobacteraceae bacterium]
MATETVAEAPPETAQAPAAPVAASPEPRAPEQTASADGAKAKGAKKGEKADNKGEKKGGKGKGSKAAKGEESGAEGPSVAAHPRAARGVARAKSWGGLVGFVLGGYLSLPTNTLAAAGLRALVAGVVCYVAVWAGAVFVWRRLVMLEFKGREQQLLAAANARRELPAPSAGRAGARAAS